MAKIGLKYPVAAPLKADGKTYDAGFVIAKAIKASVTANNNDVKLYAMMASQSLTSPLRTAHCP